MSYSFIRRLQLALGAMLLLLGFALQSAAAAPNPPFGSYLLSCRESAGAGPYRGKRGQSGGQLPDQ